MPAPLLMALPSILGGIGRLFGGAAKGSADQRAQENQQTQSQNSLIAALHNARQGATMDAARAGSGERLGQANLDLERRQFGLNAPRTRASQSVRGSILQNAQPMTLSGLPSRISSRIPQMSGGLTPAMFSADTRALGGQLTRDALIDQLKGDDFEPMKETDFSAAILQNPQLQELQRSGLLEKIMGGLGLAASVASPLSGAILNRRGSPNYDDQLYGAGE